MGYTERPGVSGIREQRVVAGCLHWLSANRTVNMKRCYMKKDSTTDFLGAFVFSDTVFGFFPIPF